MNNELESLQNAGNREDLLIHEKYFEDKRKTTKMYFATKYGRCVSPILDYNGLNTFILGWIKCNELNNSQHKQIKP